MIIVSILAIITFLFIIRLRIRKIRPHWLGNTLFLLLSFFTPFSCLFRNL